MMYLVHHHGPVTKDEIAQVTGADGQQVSQQLSRAWRDGVLVRRERASVTTRGPDPYEYAIAPSREEWDRHAEDESEV